MKTENKSNKYNTELPELEAMAEDELSGHGISGLQGDSATESLDDNDLLNVVEETSGSDSKSLKEKAFSSVLWKIAEVSGNQIVGLIISTILARLILPESYGAIAMLSIFLAISGTFIDSGFSGALIRKQNRTQVDCCTVFYFNIFVAIIFYWILFFCAPFISDFYEMPELTTILRISAIGLVLGSFSAVQSTLFNASLNFKVLVKYQVLAQVISGAAGIIMAYQGWQVWALVFQGLIANVLGSIFLWYKATWRPSLMFSFKTLKEFFSFGSKLLASSLLDTTYNNIYGIVIGKLFSPAKLALYNRATILRGLTSTMPTVVLQSVTYPTLCKVQDDENRLYNGYRRTITMSAFVVFPLCLGIGAVAYPLINILFTEKWLYAATLLQILVFAGMWYPIHAINLNLLIVKGRSDLFLRLEVIKKLIGVAMLCITIPLGLEAMCYGSIISSIISLVINTHYTKKLINFGLIKQLRDLLPIIILSGVMYVVSLSLATIIGDGFPSLIVSTISGAAVYIGGAMLFHFPEFKLLLHRGKEMKQ